MASPRALRFCWAPSGADPPTVALRDFQPRVWNGLCLGSAGLCLLGVLLLRALRRHKRRLRGSCRASDGRLATARALRTAAIASSCLGAAGILARSVLWLAVPYGMVAPPLCVVILTWVQYWFASHFWALFCYSLEAFLLLRNPTSRRSVAPYYLLCWGASATQGLPGLLLLLSADERCCSSFPRLAQVLDIVPFAATYIPLTLVLLGSPVLFSRALRAVPALLRRGMGMYTASERCQEQQLRKKFFSIVTAFAACWMANVANETLLLLELEPSWRQETWRWLRLAALGCWTIMAILNPLSGFLLTLAFSAWRSDSCARRRMPTWRTCSEIVESSSRNCSPLPETTSDPALGSLVGPDNVLEVPSLLASLDTSTSMDFICAVSENSSIQPLLHRGVQVSQEETSPGRGSCKERFLGWSFRG